MQIKKGDLVEVVKLRTVGNPENPRPVGQVFIVGNITHINCVWDETSDNSGYNSCFVEELILLKESKI